MSEHPRQPIEVDEHGIVRFKRNEVVRYIYDRYHVDLNEVALLVSVGRLPEADYRQLMQLIGYSVSGYGDLSENHSPEWQADSVAADWVAASVYAEWKLAHPDD